MAKISGLVLSNEVASRPRLGTGREVVMDHTAREISMQHRILWLRLPFRRRTPYSHVAGVGTVCRESWWSRAGDLQNPWSRFALFVVFSPSRRTDMATKGWRYDICVTVKGARTIKLQTMKDPDDASRMEGKLKQLFGLQ